MNPASRVVWLSATLLIGACAVFRPPDSAELLARKIKNSDVTWHATTLGWMPGVTGATRQLGVQLGREMAPELIKALKDENRFVAAHVILASQVGYSHGFSTSQWDEMIIDSDENGSLRIPKEQRFRLARKWEDWLSSRSKNEVIVPRLD